MQFFYTAINEMHISDVFKCIVHVELKLMQLDLPFVIPALQTMHFQGES